jgi:hypothetical protein
MSQMNLLQDEAYGGGSLTVLGVEIFPVDQYGKFNVRDISKILSDICPESDRMKPSAFFISKPTNKLRATLEKPYTSADKTNYIYSKDAKTTLVCRVLGEKFIEWVIKKSKTPSKGKKVVVTGFFDTPTLEQKLGIEPTAIPSTMLEEFRKMQGELDSLKQKLVMLEGKDKVDLEKEMVEEETTTKSEPIIRFYPDGKDRATVAGYLKLKGYGSNLKVSHIQLVASATKAYCRLNKKVGQKVRDNFEGKRESFFPIVAIEVGIEEVLKEKDHPFIKK